jgi:hypothetical protein
MFRTISSNGPVPSLYPISPVRVTLAAFTREAFDKQPKYRRSCVPLAFALPGVTARAAGHQNLMLVPCVRKRIVIVRQRGS